MSIFKKKAKAIPQGKYRIIKIGITKLIFYGE